MKLAEELLDRFFRDAEGKAERKLDVYFTIEDMSVSFDKAEPALEYLASRGLLQLFDFESAVLTDRGIDAVVDETDIKKLPKFQREWGGGASAPPAPAPVAAAPEPAAPPPAQSNLPRPERARITFVDLDGVPHTVDLGWRITVGRVDSNDVHLPDPRASKAHAEFRYAGDRYVLKDLGSANGTMANGQYIDLHPLNHGDEVIIGRTSILYECPLVIPEPRGEPAMAAAPPPPAAAAPPPPAPPPEPPKPSSLKGMGTRERAPSDRRRKQSRRGGGRGEVQVKPLTTGSVKVVQGQPMPIAVANEPSLESQLLQDDPPRNLFDDDATAAEPSDLVKEGQAPDLFSAGAEPDERPTTAPAPMDNGGEDLFASQPPPSVPDDPLGLGTPADIVEPAPPPRAPSLGLEGDDGATVALGDLGEADTGESMAADVRATDRALPPTEGDFDEKTPVMDGPPARPTADPEATQDGHFLREAALEPAEVIDDDDATPIPPRSRFARTLALLREHTERSNIRDKAELLAAIDLLSDNGHVQAVLRRIDDA